jgi:hypothetical protein
MLVRSHLARAGALGLGLALAALCSFPFASCSSGDTHVTPLPDGGGGSGGAGGSTSTASSTASSTATSSSTGMNVTWGACDQCAETACGAEEAACDGECLAIQACLETVCFNLSAIGNMEIGRAHV